MADALVNHSWIYSIRGLIRFHIEGKWITRRSRLASYSLYILNAYYAPRVRIEATSTFVSNYQNLIQNEFLISSVNRLDV